MGILQLFVYTFECEIAVFAGAKIPLKLNFLSVLLKQDILMYFLLR